MRIPRRRVRKIAESDCWILHVGTLPVCPSVIPSAWKDSASTERGFMIFDIRGFFEKSVEEIQFSLKSDKNQKSDLHKDQCIFFYHISLIYS